MPGKNGPWRPNWPMKKGSLIIIDGADGSGKATQAKLLVSRLKRQGVPVATLNIPVYESFTGRLVSSYLKNKFGQISPYLASLLYAVNRFEFRAKLVNWLNEGRLVVLNRYVTANQIHQAARLSSKTQREQLVRWIGKLEYEIFQLPKPDLVLFLNVPVEQALEMIKHKPAQARKYLKGAKDVLESDYEHQRAALKQALSLCLKERNWRKIDCMHRGRLLSKAEIADKIYTEVKHALL